MRLSTLLLPVLAGAVLAGCTRPRVVQGNTVRVEAQAQILVVRDERPPHEELRFDLAGADVGGIPQPNDLVRIAYQDDGTGTLRATRVMNLTRRESAKRR